MTEWLVFFLSYLVFGVVFLMVMGWLWPDDDPLA